MFSALSQNSTLHVLNIKDGIKYYSSPIQSVSTVRPAYPTYTVGASNGLNMGSVVDIVAIVDGKRKEFTNVPAMQGISTSENYIITDNREAMVSQIDTLMQNRQLAIDNIERYKQDVVDCKEALKTINPAYAKEAAMDSAIANLTERVNTIQSEFGNIKGDVGQILNILTNQGNK